MELKIGQYDAPQKQAQPTFSVNLLKNNIAVYGTAMSGKTSFIKSLIVRLHESFDYKREHIYIIDFGGSLNDLVDCGNVCACVDNRNEENIKRIFKTIERQLEINGDELDGRSYLSAFKKTPDSCPPHITLIIENLNAFLGDERYALYQDVLMKFCRDGLPKGLTVIFTANDVSGTTRFLSSFGQKIVFNMPTESYMDIFSNRVIKPMNLPGRCLVNIENEIYECQCFLPFAPAKENEFLDEEKAFKEFLEQNPNASNPFKLRSFPDELTEENVEKYSAFPINKSKGDVLVGLDYYEHKPIAFNYKENRAIGIYGKSLDDMTDLLALILKQIKQDDRDCRFVFVDDHRNRLEERFKDYIKEKGNVLTKKVEYIVDFAKEEGYLDDDGVCSERDVASQKPFTVFVIQHKMFYYNSNSCLYLEIPMLINNAESDNTMFIFSDIKKIADSSAYVPFNSSLSLAFLLDNIGDFVNDKGSKSVFGEMDPRELRSKFARCDKGDGYYYAAQKEDDVQKIKFIKG